MSTTWRRRTTSASSSCVSSSRSGLPPAGCGQRRVRARPHRSRPSSQAAGRFREVPDLARIHRHDGQGCAGECSHGSAFESAGRLQDDQRGEISPSFPTNCCTPSVEFGTDHASPVGETAISSTAFETSIPTNRSTGLLPPLQSVVGVTGMALPCECGLVALASVRALSQSRHDDPRSPTILEDPRVNDLSCRSSSLPPPAAPASVAWPCLAARGTSARERR